MKRSIFLKMLSTGILCVSASAFSHAQFVNPGFEDGGFTGWETLGTAEVVTADFGTPLLPGSTHAGLANTAESSSTAADIEVFLGLTTGAIAGIIFSGENGVSPNPQNGSAIKQTAFLEPGKYTVAWKFLTNEGGQEIPNGNEEDQDFLNGQDSINGSVEFNDTAFFVFNGSAERLADTFSSGFDFSGTNFSFETPEPESWGELSFFVEEAGEYTFGVGVVNVGDDFADSAIMMDSFQFTPIPEPGTVAGAALFGLLLSFAFWRRLRADKNKTAE